MKRPKTMFSIDMLCFPKTWQCVKYFLRPNLENFGGMFTNGSYRQSDQCELWTSPSGLVGTSVEISSGTCTRVELALLLGSLVELTRRKSMGWRWPCCWGSILSIGGDWLTNSVSISSARCCVECRETAATALHQNTVQHVVDNNRMRKEDMISSKMDRSNQDSTRYIR